VLAAAGLGNARLPASAQRKAGIKPTVTISMRAALSQAFPAGPFAHQYDSITGYDLSDLVVALAAQHLLTPTQAAALFADAQAVLTATSAAGRHTAAHRFGADAHGTTPTATFLVAAANGVTG
jgi:hypothetical protein